jgi:dihydrofolate synthase/folylpolyglutamate synthase
VDQVIATRAENPRAASPEEIKQAASRIAADIEEAPDVASALHKAKIAAGEKGIVVIAGSIYIVGEAMRLLDVRI